MILSGDPGPGALLPGEHDLAEQLGVTRPTVCEAMPVPPAEHTKPVLYATERLSEVVHEFCLETIQD